LHCTNIHFHILFSLFSEIWHCVNAFLAAAAACMMLSVCAGWGSNVSSTHDLAFMITEYKMPVPGTNFNYAICWYLGLESACETACPDDSYIIPDTEQNSSLMTACQPVENYTTFLDQCGAPAAEGAAGVQTGLCESMSTCSSSGT